MTAGNAIATEQGGARAVRTLIAIAFLALGVAHADTPGPAVTLGEPIPLAAPADEQGQLALVLHDAPGVTQTRQGIPGDPVNVALVGTRAEVVAAFHAAGWYSAAPITIRSSVGISVSVIFNVPYRRAPVSNLYLWGRVQNLAFEQPAGRSARSRHHVRFWCSGQTAPNGRPAWVGSGTFDESVGRSSTTGRVTHHIAPDVDRERDHIMESLSRAGRLERTFLVPHLGPTVSRNGGGDCYRTDSNLAVGIVRPCCGRGSLSEGGGRWAGD